MSISQICIEQHKKESTRLKKFLIYCFIASGLAHIIIVIMFLPYLFKRQELVEADGAIEIILIDEPEEEKKPIPTPKKSIKPERNSPLKQPQAVAQIPQDTQTILREIPLIQPEIKNPQPLRKPSIDLPIFKPEIRNPKPVFQTNLESPDIKSEIKEQTSKKIEDKQTELPEKRVAETSKPDTQISTSRITDNSNRFKPIPRESPSKLNPDTDETSPPSSNPSSIANNRGNRTLEKPINSKPLDESFADNNETPTVIADNRNSSGIFNSENNDSPLNSNPSS
ncbi:MAG: hypothetical protein AAFV71_26070, partial [Cyanobacteria bacterium J06633_8]